MGEETKGKIDYFFMEITRKFFIFFFKIFHRGVESANEMKKVIKFIVQVG